MKAVVLPWATTTGLVMSAVSSAVRNLPWPPLTWYLTSWPRGLEQVLLVVPVLAPRQVHSHVLPLLLSTAVDGVPAWHCCALGAVTLSAVMLPQAPLRILANVAVTVQALPTAPVVKVAWVLVVLGLNAVPPQPVTDAMVKPALACTVKVALEPCATGPEGFWLMVPPTSALGLPSTPSESVVPLTE